MWASSETIVGVGGACGNAGFGARLGADTVTGAVAWQQQDWGQQRHCRCRHLWLVPFSCVRTSLVGGGGGGCLPGSCLAAASTSSSPPPFSTSPLFFLLPTPSSPFPSFVHEPSRSLTRRSASCEVGGCGGLVMPTDTGWRCGGGDVTPVRVAS